MARIGTYNLDESIDGSEKLIGSDAAGLTTRNFTIDSIAGWLNSNSVIGIAGQSNFLFQHEPNVDGRLNGSISFQSYGGDGTSFSDLTSIKFSGRRQDGSDISPYLVSLVSEVVILFDTENISNFGIYTLTSFEVDQTGIFYDAVLSLEQSNGSLIGGNIYGYAIYPSTAITPTLNLDNVTDAGNTTTNSIDIGGLTVGALAYPNTDGSANQFIKTDGAGTLSFSTIDTPNLDSVTTEGNTTTNAVEVGGLTAVDTSSPVVKLEATSETNPTSNEVMGTLTFSRKFTDPDTPSLIETLYNDFTTRVEADGGEVNGTLADVTTDISDLVSGKYQLDTAHIKSEYTGVPFNTSSDMVFYTSTGTSVTEKFRITKDGNIEVKESLAGVVIRSRNDTPYRILVDNDGRLEATALDAAAPVINGVPTISGIVAITETITATKASVTSSPALTTTYQWQVSDTGTGGWSNISGATSASYLIPLEYANKFLRVQQIETNILGQATANSASTTAVIPSVLVTAMVQRLDNFENETYVYDSLIDFDAIELS